MQEPSDILSRKKFLIEDGILIFLLILCLAGIAVTDFSAADGYVYWVITVFIFAVSAIIIAWLQSKQNEVHFGDIVKEQTLHWLTTLLIVFGTFLLQKSEQLTADNADLVILLILSLATMLDGLRIGWKFSLVGLFLGASSIIGAFFEYFLWIDIGIAIFIVMASFAWEIWINRWFLK
jgi:hypothetical protein